MQVEINAENIVKYNLVQLTGNPAEVLLQRAAEAEQEGYVLACTIPDTHEYLEQNIFEAAGSSQMTREEQDAWYERGSVIEGGVIENVNNPITCNCMKIPHMQSCPLYKEE